MSNVQSFSGIILVPGTQGQIDLKAIVPNRLRARFTGPGIDAELLQDQSATFTIDHLDKTYDQTPAAPSFGGFAAWAESLVGVIPTLLFGLAGLKEQIKEWKVLPREALNGWETEPIQGKTEQDTFTIWVDATGFPRKLRHQGVTEFGPFDRVWMINNPEVNAVDPTMIVAKIPSGYDFRVTPQLTYPPISDDKLNLSVSLVNARTSRPFDLNREKGNRVAAVIVSQANCEPTLRAEEALRDLEAAFSKNNGVVYEIIVGSQAGDLSKKSSSRTILLDHKGELMREWRPAVSPTIFLVDGKDMLLRGWAGYGPDQRKKLVETLLRGLKQGSE
jgi:hypothetical protein